MSITGDLSFAKEFLPKGYTVRPLHVDDYMKGVLDVLSQLTYVGPISKDQFDDYVREIKKNDNRQCTLVVSNENLEIAAIGSVLIERKLIHQCGSVGHIEDISVGHSEQGKGLGYSMIRILDTIAKKQGVYKCILNCSEALKGFYEKCEYKNEGYVMVSRRPGG